MNIPYSLWLWANFGDVAELGDPVDDLTVATVLMVVGGQLILLRPRKVSIGHLILCTSI